MPIRVRYLWFYLLTTDFSQIIGIFYLPLDMVAAETGLDIVEVKQYLMELTDLKMLLFSPDTSEVIIFNFPKYNIFGWNEYIKSQIENELATVKNLNLIKIMIDTLHKFIKKRTNDKVRASYLQKALKCCENALKPYIPKHEKEKFIKEKGLDVDLDVEYNNGMNKEKECIEKDDDWEEAIRIAKTPWLREF